MPRTWSSNIEKEICYDTWWYGSRKLQIFKTKQKVARDLESRNTSFFKRNSRNGVKQDEVSFRDLGVGVIEFWKIF